MDQAKLLILSNLASNAAAARRRMALSINSLSTLTKLPIETLSSVEQGSTDIDLELDELINLALSLGLTVNGEVRARPTGVKAEP